MKYNNLILITLTNTLHIKADNLEPVEVDSSCVRELETEAGFIFGRTETLTLRGFYDAICKGLGISELSDRIEVRNCTKYINTESYSVPVVCKRAFLLPEKEWADTKDFTWKDATEEEIQSEALPSLTEKYGKSFEKSYTIEEIERAIEEHFDNTIYRTEHIKHGIINYLKK